MKFNRREKVARCAMLRAEFVMITLIAFAPIQAAERRPVVCVVGSAAACAQDAGVLRRLKEGLEKDGAISCGLVPGDRGAESSVLAHALQSADVVVVYGKQFVPAPDSLQQLRQFINTGKGLVVLGRSENANAEWAEFVEQASGARYTGKFAAGEAMKVINLYPHAIFTGVRTFAANQSMVQCSLASDAQVIMEGTVGETTVPMAWIRSGKNGRVFSVSFGDDKDLSDSAYLRIVANGVHWVAKSAIPGAVAIIQRAYLPDSYPGSFAITFPQGPSVCFDPVRGGINYVWDGDFVDLRPAWTTKHGAAQREFAGRYFGDVFYDEDLKPPLHLNSKDAVSPYQFRGYRMEAGVPIFRYKVGNREITERISQTPDRKGIVRRLSVAAGDGVLYLQINLETVADIAVEGAIRDGNFVRYDNIRGGDFSITIRQKTKGMAP